MIKFLAGFVTGLIACVAIASYALAREEATPLRPLEADDEPCAELEMSSPDGTYRFRGHLTDYYPTMDTPSPNQNVRHC